MADDSVGLVKTSYDDVNSALEGLIGNISAGNTANYITADKLNQILSGYATPSQISTIAQSAASVPVGTVLSFGSNTIPNGYLLCNGASFDTGKYATLYSAIGSASVPDLRGLFLRGLDTSGTIDNFSGTRSLFSFEEGSYSVKDIFTNVTSFYANGDTSNASLLDDNWDARSNTNDNKNYTYASRLGTASTGIQNANGASMIGVTRPKNSAVNYIIKAQ